MDGTDSVSITMNILVIILVVLAVILLCIFGFFALVLYLIGKGLDNREKEAHEVIKNLNASIRQQENKNENEKNSD